MYFLCNEILSVLRKMQLEISKCVSIGNWNFWILHFFKLLSRCFFKFGNMMATVTEMKIPFKKKTKTSYDFFSGFANLWSILETWFLNS